MARLLLSNSYLVETVLSLHKILCPQLTILVICLVKKLINFEDQSVNEIEFISTAGIISIGRIKDDLLLTLVAQFQWEKLSVWWHDSPQTA